MRISSAVSPADPGVPQIGGEAGGVKDDAVPDLVEQIHPPQRGTAQDDGVTLFAELLAVDVQDDKQQRYDVPF